MDGQGVEFSIAAGSLPDVKDYFIRGHKYHGYGIHDNSLDGMP